MEVILSTRHMDANDHLKELVRERLARLDRFEPRVQRAEVTLLEEKNRCEVEVQVSVAGSSPIHAHAESTDFRTALDRVVDKLARQLKKNHSRRRDHQASPKDIAILDEHTP